MKRFLFGAAALAITLALVALSIPRLFDLDGLKPRVASEFRRATGLALAIDGDLVIDLVPVPRIAASAVRIREAGAVSDLARVRAVRADLKPLRLLLGEVEVAEFEVVGPRVELDRFWDRGGQAREDDPFPPLRGPGGDIRLDRIRIVDGAVSWRDAAGAVELVDGVTVDVGADSLAGPFTVTGTARVRGREIGVDARVGRPAGGGGRPVSLSGRLATAAVSLQGALDLSGGAPRLSGRVRVEGASLAGFMGAIGGAGPPAGLDGPFGLAAAVAAGEREVELSGMSVQVGHIEATGGATYALGSGGGVDMTLDVARIDVDGLLGRVRAAAGGGAAAAAEPGPVRFPPDIDLALELAVGEVVLGGDSVRDLRTAVSLRDGELSLRGLTARLPGGAALEVSGRAGTRDGLAYQGRAALRADNARPLLEWAGVATGAIAGDRLRRLSVESGFSGGAGRLRLVDMRGRLDASNLEGGLAVALARRPSFGASLRVDNLNLDSYLTAAPEGPEGPARPGAGPGAGGEARAGPPALAALAALARFDAAVSLRVGSLGYRGLVASGVRLDGSLVDGTLTVRDAGVRGLGGAELALSGTLSGVGEAPELEARLTAAGSDPGPLIESFGLDPGAGSGPLDLSVRAGSREEGLAVDIALEAAGGRFTAAGTGPPLAALLAGSLEGGRELRMSLRHPDLSRLARLLHLGDIGAEGVDVGVDAVVTGGADALGVRAEARTLGGVLEVSGGVAGPPAAPVLGLRARLRHPDPALAVQRLVPGSGGGDIGALSLDAGLLGPVDDVTIKGLKATVGAVELVGGGLYRSAGPRPRIDLSLSSPAVALGNAERGPAETPGAGGPWSPAAFAFGAPAGVDARLQLEIGTLSLGPVAVDGARIVAGLEDGALSLDEMTGGVAGGDLRATGAVEAGGSGRAAVSVSVDGARVSGPLFGTGGVDISGGELDLAASLTARGRSGLEMARTLGGSGRWSVRDGRIEGFDIDGVRSALDASHDQSASARLIEAALRGGATGFSSLGGGVAVKDGVARLDGTAFVSPGASADVEGAVDLAAWTADLEAAFRLRDPAGAPPFTIGLSGPLGRLARTPDFGDLQLWGLARGLGRLVRGLDSGGVAGGEAPPAAAGAPPAAEAAPAAAAAPAPGRERGGTPESGAGDGIDGHDAGRLVDDLIGNIR